MQDRIMGVNMMRRFRIVLLGLFMSGVGSQSLIAHGADASLADGFPVVSGKAALTVSGDGYLHREIYGDGEVPTISVRDNSGQLLPDGVYRFQFTSSPAAGSGSARQRAVMTGEDLSPGVGGAGRGSNLSGTFEIQGGQVVYQ
jgi:hypothetical protein